MNYIYFLKYPVALFLFQEFWVVLECVYFVIFCTFPRLGSFSRSVDAVR